MPTHSPPAWRRPGGPPRIETGSVQLHRVRLEAGPDEERELAACLPADEIAAAGRFRFERDRRNFTLRRALLRRILAGYLGVAAAAVRFVANEFGKPSVADAADVGDLRFSYSHSGDQALLAVTLGRELGVDLEQHRAIPDALQMAESFFAPREVAALKALPADELAAAFFACWTRKEAFIKALGLGLSFPLNAFAVSLEEPASLLELHGVPPPAGAWTLQSLPVGAGWSAALVVQGAGWDVACWDGWRGRG